MAVTFLSSSGTRHWSSSITAVPLRGIQGALWISSILKEAISQSFTSFSKPWSRPQAQRRQEAALTIMQDTSTHLLHSQNLMKHTQHNLKGLFKEDLGGPILVPNEESLC